MRKFASLYESIRSYMNNLNTHSAYRRLRQIRQELRSAGKAVTGTALAKGLSRYSQRGEEYITEIQSMIRQNSLERINAAALRLPEKKPINNVNTTGAGLFSTRNRLIGHLLPPRHDP